VIEIKFIWEKETKPAAKRSLERLSTIPEASNDFCLVSEGFGRPVALKGPQYK
jgi:hypothetical protein